MVSHSHHPPTHTYGLADQCPRCQEHSQHPELSLDPENLRRLIAQATDRADMILTDNDAIATAKVRNTLEDAGRLLQADAEAVCAFFREQYGVVIHVRDLRVVS